MVFSADLRNKPIFSYSPTGTLPDKINGENGETPEAVLGLIDDFICFNKWIRESDNSNVEDTVIAQFILENTNEWGDLLHTNQEAWERLCFVRQIVLPKELGYHPCKGIPMTKIDEYEAHNTGILLATTWAQGEPYNYDMPVLINGKKAYVGCTAVAQIMRFHSYPYNMYIWGLMPNNMKYMSYDNMKNEHKYYRVS